MHVARQVRVALPAYLGQGGAQPGLGGERVRREPAQRAGEYPFLQLPAAERQQHQPGRRHVQRQPPRDPCVVDHGARRGQPFHEQHLVAVEDAKLHVVAEHRVGVLHERHARLAQAQRGRGAEREFPHPHADPDPAVRLPGEQPVRLKLRDQPRGRGRMQPGPPRDLRHRQDLLVRGERLEDAHRPRQHRLARRHPGHSRRLTRGTLACPPSAI